jgi:DNA-binding PadR family transcriptional regulator
MSTNKDVRKINKIKKNRPRKKFEPKTSSKNLAQIASILKEKFRKEEREKNYARIKDVLTMLAAGTTLAMVFIMPGTAPLLKIFTEKERKNWEEWKKFNPAYLRRSLERLKKQKLVEIEEKDGKTIVKITKAGRQKVLKYALDELEIAKLKVWDRKWRVVIYDVPENKQYLQKLFREAAKKLGFLRIQKSVYLYPFPCYEQIEFLREYFNLGENIIYMVVEQLEDDLPYRKYFSLK